MMSVSRITSVAALALGVAAYTPHAVAQPSIYAQQNLSGIRNETSSVLVGDLVNARAAYVLPPATGRSILSSFVPGGNLEHCQTMSDLQATSRDLAAQMASLSLDTSPIDAELERLRQEKARLRDIMVANGGYRTLEQRRQSLLLDVFDLEDILASLEETCFASVASVASCPADPVASLAACGPSCPAEIQAEIAEIQAEIASLNAEAATLATRAADQRLAYENAKQGVDDIAAQEVALSDELIARMSALVAARDQVIATYAQYASLTGGTAVLEYQSGWDQNVARLQADNAAFTFTPISTSEARVVAGLAGGIGRDSYLAMTSSIKSYTVNGTPVSDGSAAIPFSEYPKNVRVDATLALVAACIQQAPQLFDVEKTDANLPLFAMTVTYKYPTVFFTDVVAEFNLWRIYERIRAAGQGLWSTRVDVVLAEPDVGDRIHFDWLESQQVPLPLPRPWPFPFPRPSPIPLPSPLPSPLPRPFPLPSPSTPLPFPLPSPRLPRALPASLASSLASPLSSAPLDIRPLPPMPPMPPPTPIPPRPPLPPRPFPLPLPLPSPEPPDAVRREAEQRIVYELIQEIMASVGEVRDGGDVFARYNMPAAPRSNVVLSLNQRQPFALRSLIPTSAYDSTLSLATVVTVPDPIGGPVARSLTGESPGLQVSATRPVTVVIPGEVTRISFDERTTPQQLRVLTSAIQLAKRRRSPECGWYNIWCDGQTWTERVTPSLIQALLDRWQTRRYDRLTVSQKIGSTLYAP